MLRASCRSAILVRETFLKSSLHYHFRAVPSTSAASFRQRRFFAGRQKDDDFDQDLEKLKKEVDDTLKKADRDDQREEIKLDPKFMDFKRAGEKSAHDRSHIFNWKAAAATLFVGLTCLAALLYIRQVRIEERERERKKTAGKARIGGPWQLVNMEGKPEGSEDLKGKWVLMYFGFTHCPDICPDEIEKMVKVVELLEKEQNPPVPIVPVFISVDPARDTIPRVKEYCAEFSPKIRGYTGSKEQVAAVTKTFRVYHSEGPKTTPDDYIVDHTVIMYLVDPDGIFHDYYGQNRKAEEIANVIRAKVLKYELSKKNRGLFSF